VNNGQYIYHMNYIQKQHTYLLKKMYACAKADFNKPRDGVTWTPNQVFAFRRWMIDYLKTHKAAREALMRQPDKKMIETTVDNFIKRHGFTLL